MMENKKSRKNGTRNSPSKDYHLVLGAGGSKAILASTGAIAAFELSGWNQWKTIGGVSGGSIPAALYANDTRAKEIVWLALNTDFSKLLEPRVGPMRRLFAILRKYRYEVTLPEKGIYSAESLQRFMDISVPHWPEQFWTICTDRKGNQVVFTKEGAFRYLPEIQKGIMLTEEPPCLGLAVATSCAIPGIIDAGIINGEPLFDGAMGHEGQCPVLPPQRHFGAAPGNIIGMDVGEEDVKKNPFVFLLMRLTCWVSACGPINAPHPSEEEDGIILMEPRVKGFHGLKFLLDDLDKWSAIIAGFNSAIETLERHSLISRSDPEAAKAYQLRDALDEVPIGKESRIECAECIAGLFKSFDVL